MYVIRSYYARSRWSPSPSWPSWTGGNSRWPSSSVITSYSIHYTKLYDARYGGDEFAVILPETDLAATSAIAGRIAAGISQVRLDTKEGATISFTASIGYAVITSYSIHYTKLYEGRFRWDAPRRSGAEAHGRRWSFAGRCRLGLRSARAS